GFEGGFMVYKNMAADSGKVAFLPYPGGAIKTNRPGNVRVEIAVNSMDIPAIVDLDGDGDLDVLTYDQPGSRIEYHKNVCKDFYGHSDSLIYRFEEACWGHVMENGSANAMILNIACKDGVAEQLHAGSSLLALDLDGDGDKDLLSGDVGYDNMIQLTNGGTAAHADMVSQTTQFPASNPIHIDIFPAAYHLDFDNDQKRDLMVAPNNTFDYENTRSAWWYKNTGTDAAPVFTYYENDLLQSEMMDVGSGAAPLLYDYNGDGKTDLLAGNFGVYQYGQHQPALAVINNQGSPQAPSFTYIAEDILYLPSGSAPGIAPALGDLDGDGDPDLLLGKANGMLDYYQNFSFNPSSVFPTFIPGTVGFQGIDVGQYAVPQLIDVDGDSLTDLLVGEKDGNINYFRNTGSAASPAFTLISETWGGVQVAAGQFQPGHSAPCLYRYKDTTHLLVGAESGRIFHYVIPEGGLEGNFTLKSTQFGGIDAGKRSVPTLADLDGDSLPDLVVGNYSGGMALYMGVSTATTRSEVPSISLSMKVFPNPAKGFAEIRTDFHPYPVTATLSDLRGAVQLRTDVPAGRGLLSLQGITPGYYQVSLRDSRGVFLGAQGLMVE
ncbi:MAG: VCBS repeat-containing protein, partial [Bacteroidetes bacterium]